MIVNVIHRPAAGSLQKMFCLQQDIAHELGLKVTVLIPFELMYDKEVMDKVREYREQYQDELGIWFGEIAGEKMNQVFRCREPFLWLYSMDGKERLIRTVLSKFLEEFGFAPKAVGAYHVDAYSMRLFRQLCPEIKISIAGCFEEGVKVFHGCNNSWYLFNEGMPWGPWYPAKENTLREAENAENWEGIVAVPHLSRDLALSYEGRNDFFASHPANVQRAMANDGENMPYMYNLLDMYRYQERFNGFSYSNVFVGPNWLQGNPNIQDSDEISQQLYRDYLTYFTALKKEGRLTDMYMSEFADWYTGHIPIGESQVYLAKEILYGSGKHYFWYNDPYMRVTVDTCQGGSIGDFRPLIAKQRRCTGSDMPDREIGSNPYLIHSQYRTGNSCHYADGARTTLLLKHGTEQKDLADYPVKVESVERTYDKTILKLTPAIVRFSDGASAAITTCYEFCKEGKIYIKRSCKKLSETVSELEVTEYFKGSFGTTEYPEDMSGVILRVKGQQEQSLTFTYLSRDLKSEEPGLAEAEIPRLNTTVSLLPDEGSFVSAAAEEGYLFNPYYTLTVNGVLQEGKEISTCLKITKSK